MAGTRSTIIMLTNFSGVKVSVSFMLEEINEELCRLCYSSAVCYQFRHVVILMVLLHVDITTYFPSESD